MTKNFRQEDNKLKGAVDVEVVDIVWHLLAVFAVVGVVLYLNLSLAGFSERERLLGKLLWACSLPAGQTLPAARWQRLCTQTLSFYEKELVKRFYIRRLKLNRPHAFDGLVPETFLVPLWALVLASAEDLNLMDAAFADRESLVTLNQQQANLATVAKILQGKKAVTLSWENDRWHFAVS